MIIFCEKCGLEFENSSKWGAKRFCSRKCANSRGPMSDEAKQLRREYALKNPKGSILYAKNPKYNLRNGTYYKCSICNIEFYSNKSRGNRKYCSITCWKIGSGGLRPNSGIGKTGWYKGFYLRSTYELAFVIYCLAHNINIKPFKGYYNYIDPIKNKIRKYYPDFIIDNKIIEIKGYKTYVDELKIKSVDKPIEIKYKNDLVNEFQYVENDTGLKIKDLYLLYDK
jgi:hypothetical protein